MKKKRVPVSCLARFSQKLFRTSQTTFRISQTIFRISQTILRTSQTIFRISQTIFRISQTHQKVSDSTPNPIKKALKKEHRKQDYCRWFSESHRQFSGWNLRIPADSGFFSITGAQDRGNQSVHLLHTKAICTRLVNRKTKWTVLTDARPIL